MYYNNFQIINFQKKKALWIFHIGKWNIKNIINNIWHFGFQKRYQPFFLIRINNMIFSHYIGIPRKLFF